MQAMIDVESMEDKAAVELAMTDPMVRAFVLIAGTLAALPSDRARSRVLSWAYDRCDEQREAEKRLRSAPSVDAVDPVDGVVTE